MTPPLPSNQMRAVSEALAAEDAEAAGGTGTGQEEPHEADNNKREVTARLLKEARAK